MNDPVTLQGALVIVLFVLAVGLPLSVVVQLAQADSDDQRLGVIALAGGAALALACAALAYGLRNRFGSARVSLSTRTASTVAVTGAMAGVLSQTLSASIRLTAMSFVVPILSVYAFLLGVRAFHRWRRGEGVRMRRVRRRR